MTAHRILERFIARYSCGLCRQTEPASIDLIIPISYCTTPYGLTRATRENVLQAIRYGKRFPSASIAFSNAEYVFEGAAEIESSQKRRLLCDAQIPDSSVLEAPPIMNSIQEATAIRELLDRSHIQPARILIVTGQMHAPSARIIYKNSFPKAEIFIHCIPHHLETQKDHPLAAQQTPLKWLVSNLGRHIFVLTLGLTVAARFHHRASPVIR